MLKDINGKIVFQYNNEKVWIEAWGKNAVRVRATRDSEMPSDNWALEEEHTCDAQVYIGKNEAKLINGKIKAVISKAGKISFYNEEKLVLEEYVRNRVDVTDKNCSALMIDAREFRPILGGDYAVTMRFESDPNEKIFGMGQYQQPYLDLKGCELELAQRNSQATVPFMISSLGYGFLWNNPAIGKVVFGKNRTTWSSESTKILDYWITVGDRPAEIEENYAAVTGKVPMMPDYGMGFWQCKLRYQTQEELLNVAREYKKRGIPLDMIVIDFFHWEREGTWKFDSLYWPDPKAMVKELEEMGTKLMVSIWPTVDHKSENYEEMLEKGLLINVERGYPQGLFNGNNTLHIDATNPKTREYVWKKLKENYYDHGIKAFWLDEAEPEYDAYQFDNYRYAMGTNLQIGNIYPKKYTQMVYEGMEKEGQKNILNLVRCAWAGSQKYGALVWSGDIASSFESMRNQIIAGLNMGLAGITWWTTDIGGFHGGNPNDESFRELFLRWFAYGTFCPVMRLHGDREPHSEPLSTTGGGAMPSGGPNEVWSYGEKAYEICKKYIFIRKAMKNYIKTAMEQAHNIGTPVMRTMFYQFPDDPKCWEMDMQYMFGDEILVASVAHAGQTKMKVYLPKGYRWYDMWTEEEYEGGQEILMDAPLEKIPLLTTNKKNCEFVMNNA